jgi:ABC-2 type transport system permease protein
VRRRLLEQYHVSDLRDLPVDPIGVEMLEADEQLASTIHPLLTDIYDAMERQERLTRALGWLNPLLALRSLSMAMAASDVAAHRRFVDAAESYRRTFAHILHVATRDHPAYRTSPVFPGTDIIVTPGSPALWAQVPAFSYRAATFSEIIRVHASDFIILGAWVVVAALAASVATRRLRVA